MKRFLTLVTVLITGITLSGCDFVGEIFSGEKTYRGTVAFGFEASDFSPCTSDERWWITGDDETYTELYDSYRDLGLEWYQPAYAQLRGSRSAAGEYGHLGAYSREFEVSDIVEIRELEEGECR